MVKWTYYCDCVEYPRLNRPEAWSKTTEEKNAMFSSYPVFEFIPGTKGDEEPLRFGDFVLDIDTKDEAINDAKKIIAYFEENYSIMPDEWEIYLSGKKGVHLVLPDYVFGLENGHKHLTLGYKRLAKEIEGELGISIDCSMFNSGTGKPFRRVNVLRQDTQTYKVQIDYDSDDEEKPSLCTITDDYVDICSRPRDTWKTNAKYNDVLAKKLKEYLLYISENLVKQIPLTQEQIEALKEAPPCMKYLSCMTSPPTGCSSTFNDVAIQLTAYAISAGMDEQRFLSGCQSFIYQYPSTSLTTHKKRLDNVVARFRNMSTTGSYIHSCGCVMALGIRDQWSCFGCHYKKLEHTEKICSSEDVCLDETRSTCIPSSLLEDKGLITLGLEAAKLWSCLEIVQYNLPVVIAHIATAIAGKIRYDNIHPSFFIIKIGTTSTGKSDSDKDFKNNISPFFEFVETVDGKQIKRNTFYGANDYSSGPAILRSVSKNPKSLTIMDEIKFFFDKGKGYDPNAQGKIQAILELSTSAGQVYRKPYADSNNEIVIEYPVPNLIGNATESIFNAFSFDDMESGLVQRFDFFCYEGKTPYRLEKNRELAKSVGTQFAERIYDLRNLDQIGYCTRNKIHYDLTQLPAVNIGMTPDAEELRKEYSKKIIDIVNSHDDGGKKGIINRAYNTSIKLALVHAGATRACGDDFFRPLDIPDLEWGIALADILYKWKLDVFVKSLNSGEFDKMCEMFLAATKAAHRNKQKPTGNVLINKRPKLRNLTTRQWDEVVKVLIARKQIVVTPGSPTLYYPSKEK